MLSTGATLFIVENNPDVMKMTKLALRSFLIYQQPVRTITASSAAEATTMLQTSLITQQGLSLVMVILIGTDLETPHAWMELCRFIREEMRDREIQLYLHIETLDAVPERSLFDQYLIAGYYTTAEIATDKLYSLIKIGVHNYRALVRTRVMMWLIESLVVARSREHIARVLSDFINARDYDITGKLDDRADKRVAMLFNGQIVAKHLSLSHDSILATWKSLRQQPGTPLGKAGDKYVVDDEYLLVHLEPGQTRAAFSYLCFLTGEMPDSFVSSFYHFACVAATLWKYAP